MLLEVDDLNFHYGTVKAIENVSLHVNSGEIVAMIGPNGAGKSTSLKAVSGLLDSAGGQIKNGDMLFEGRSINGLRTDRLVEKTIALMPEGRRVFPTMTVLENVEMGARTRAERRSVENDSQAVFNLFPRLKERAQQKAGTLSSDEQQMLALGRASMLNPELLLADEPSLGLSFNFVDLIFDRIVEINKAGTSILRVKQNARMVLEVAHRAYVFEIGRIGSEGSTDSLRENPQVKKAFWGG